MRNVVSRRAARYLLVTILDELASEGDELAIYSVTGRLQFYADCPESLNIHEVVAATAAAQVLKMMMP